MGKFNEIQEQTTQSWGANSFTTTIKDNTVEFDSAKDKFTFKDPVEVPSINVGGTESVPFSAEDKTKLDSLQTPMQIKGRVDSVSDLPTEDVNVGDTYLVGLSGSETFDEYVCTGFAGSPEAPVWESVGSTQVQADWNQNDDTKVDYIKNRICYEGNVSYSFTPSGGGAFDYQGPAIEIGKTYGFKLDNPNFGFDTDVTATAINVSDPSLGAQLTAPNGMYLQYYPAGYNYTTNKGYWTGAGGSEVTVSGESVATIPDKFISSNIARTSDLSSLPISAGGGTNSSFISSINSTNPVGNYSSLIATSQSNISASTGEKNAIVADQGSDIYAGNCSAIVASFESQISSSNGYSNAVVAAYQSQINNGSYSLVTGNKNSCTASINFICGEENSALAGEDNIIGGYKNQVSGGAKNLVVGEYNNVMGNDNFVGGRNSINAMQNVPANESFIFGVTNTTTSSTNSAFIFGTSNTVSASSCSMTFGTSNTNSGYHCLILGGSGNTASGSNQVIIGCENVSATANDTVYMQNINASGNLTLGDAILKEDSGALKVSFDGGTTWLTISAS